eukprot:SAG11_NODE_35240_length_267_cov_1.238095_1_plen_44_part_01
MARRPRQVAPRLLVQKTAREISAAEQAEAVRPHARAKRAPPPVL